MFKSQINTSRLYRLTSADGRPSNTWRERSQEIPQYEGPNVNWYTFLDALRTMLGNDRVPYACQEHIDFCSDVFDQPSSKEYEMVPRRVAPLIEGTQPAEGSTMVRLRPGGDPLQKKLFIGPHSPLKSLADLPEVGEDVPILPECSVPVMVRTILEKKCYLSTERCIDKTKYNYLITNAGVEHGDSHALLKALSGEAGSNPDKYLKRLKDRCEDEWLESQHQWPTYWASLQLIWGEMAKVKNLKTARQYTPHEKYELMAKHVRVVSPRINDAILNKGCDFTLIELIEQVENQRLEVGLSDNQQPSAGSHEGQCCRV
jgi:hypothetical protein